MTNDDIQLLYEYDRWANDRILHAAASLGVEEFTRDLGGSFRSVRDTLVHIVGSEWAWLTYWLEPSPTSDFLESLWTREEKLFAPSMFPDIAAVQTKWVEVERQQIHFANGITNNSLAQTLPVRGKKSAWRILCNTWSTTRRTIGVKLRECCVSLSPSRSLRILRFSYWKDKARGPLRGSFFNQG